MAELLPVQQQLADLLQAGHTLAVRWDCGGDESFVYTELDGVEQEAEYDDEHEDFPTLLDRYLTDLLSLPDVGEFNMEGTGRIFLEGREVVIEYQSRALVYWDDDDSWKDEFTPEQLADMGVSPREIESPPLTTVDVTPPAPPSDEADDEEPAGSYDPDMSDEYSGRQVLFMLP